MATKLLGASISLSSHPPHTKTASCKINLSTNGVSIQSKNQANHHHHHRQISKSSCRCELGTSTNYQSHNKRPLSTTDLKDSVSNGTIIRVAYQGVSGAYSESAAEKAYPNCETVPCEQFDIAFQAVENWIVDRAVLPIENSLGGSIHRNYDLLLRHSLHIVGEVQLSVRHCLLANHGVKIEDLTRVLSHPQALAQCEHTLTRLRVVREAVDDTAGAAQFVALNKLKDTGAVASIGAARIYDLNVLAQDIQDDADNITRFLMLAREPIIPRTDRPFKTSIVFSLDEGPGMLYKALAVFSMRDINLTKIESRPQRNHPLLQPIENSNGSNLHIVGEVQLSVRHCLLANHGVKIEDLTRVLSHPQALAQCEHTLTRLRVVREAVDDTAGAAQFVALNKLKDTGAVASIGAARIYDLNVLAQDIQDDADNITRFLMLAREPIIPRTDRPFKTSIVFSLDEGPGMLYKALAVFSMRDINLTKIESRPQRNHPLLQPIENSNGSKHFDYLFYCDFEASMADPNAQNALKHLKEFATFLRVLGSYPTDNNLV